MLIIVKQQRKNHQKGNDTKQQEAASKLANHAQRRDASGLAMDETTETTFDYYKEWANDTINTSWHTSPHHLL